MVLDRFARFLVLAAFVAAQASALSHSIWHVASSAGGVGIAAAGSAADGSSGTNPLCSQHGALDDVLGALHGAAIPADAASLRAHAALPCEQPAASLAALAPSSRGPPVSL
ncbi:MAG: hypothetical protein ACM30H_03015 [Clostridia bacterium]